MRDLVLNLAIIAQLSGLLVMASLDPLRIVLGLWVFIGGAVLYRHRQRQRREEKQERLLATSHPPPGQS
ncbi:hypothetical protein [Pseudoxanthomonas suwonensis]|uniref:hypothetical protein n=1 Tax=Pseudoxanthomonas suwonensis TaxID=314722 RepID=UPI0004907855|nr:hypothetical protein [Pseudoxanthomonas suwonensis]